MRMDPTDGSKQEFQFAGVPIGEEKPHVYDSSETVG